MNGHRHVAHLVIAAGLLGRFAGALPAPGAEGDKPLVMFDFEDAGVLRLASVNADAKFGLVDAAGGGKALRIETGHREPWPGITIKAPKGKWDLSTYRRVKMDVRNLGAGSATVCLRVDNPGADGQKNCVTGSIQLDGGKSGTLSVEFTSTPFRLTPPVKIVGMRGTPGAAGRLDPTNVTQVLVFAPQPKADQVFAVDNIRAEGRVVTKSSKDFFPFIDEFGQYVHADWPGKLHSADEYKQLIAAEGKDLAARPAPEGWDKWGGWAAGPKLEATGFFRPAKHAGKWWLVDPEGRLFWSHGTDCVHAGHATTPITERKGYFRSLPGKDSPFAAFYGGGSWAPHGYYQGKGRYETYDFSSANLLRKWGRNWRGKNAVMSHRRLRSWGMNTIANWSDSRIYLQRRTPYVVAVHFGSPSIEGSSGYWGKFPDVFHEGFRAALRKRMAGEKGRSAGDPWCIGYFVGNELGWGGEDSLGVAALVSPPDQPAKKAFVADLKARYASIGKLNAAWGAKHASWDALLAGREAPDRGKARADLRAFYTHAAETYFRICREECRRAAPDNLYLGCRFAWRNDRAVRAAAKSCDVVSFNFYAYRVPDKPLPAGIDKPVIVGEFHFGALDRGMFHTGLRATKDQLDRARKYREYVRGAMANPYYVGAHWFQYGDQATTGRGDGENYQIGLVNVADVPYPETIAAVREVGYPMYEYRRKAR